jgi:LmbE family N-acetylglucosaminyl deacetylase
MNILVISPHPDDLEYGCGGTLVKYSRKGHKIHLMYMTAGEMGGDPKVRRREAERAAKLLKAQIYWAGFTDTNIPLAKETINRIEEVIRKVRPTLIFTPYYNDTHQDHRYTSQATFTASRYSRNVLFYEVPTTVDFNPTVFVDIGSVLPQKLALLRAHRSQVFQTKVPGLSILENARSTAVFRGTQHRVRFAEGFHPARLTLDFA